MLRVKRWTPNFSSVSNAARFWLSVAVGASARVPESCRLTNSGCVPAVDSNRSVITLADVVHAERASWHVSHVRPLVPMLSKNGLVRSMTPLV